MTVRLTYWWPGVQLKARDIRESPTRLDDIPDGVTVTFRSEGGDVQVGIGLVRERRLTSVADGQEVDLDVPMGPVAVWLVSRKE
jgi:cold shock CspA family protein